MPSISKKKSYLSLQSSSNPRRTVRGKVYQAKFCEQDTINEKENRNLPNNMIILPRTIENSSVFASENDIFKLKMNSEKSSSLEESKGKREKFLVVRKIPEEYSNCVSTFEQLNKSYNSEELCNNSPKFTNLHNLNHIEPCKTINKRETNLHKNFQPFKPYVQVPLSQFQIMNNTSFPLPNIRQSFVNVQGCLNNINRAYKNTFPLHASQNNVPNALFNNKDEQLLHSHTSSQKSFIDAEEKNMIKKFLAYKQQLFDVEMKCKMEKKFMAKNMNKLIRVSSLVEENNDTRHISRKNRRSRKR